MSGNKNDETVSFEELMNSGQRKSSELVMKYKEGIKSATEAVRANDPKFIEARANRQAKEMKV